MSPWLVAVAVVVPTFMEVLDTTVANVALRYIAGGLSASAVDGEWVITSYLAANAFVLPISGWLSAHLGRRTYFLASITVFTIASGLCGIATSLPQLVLFRILQGLAGGGLQPSSQAILLDTFPRERQGAAMTMFGVAALTGPIVGPTLGGWLVVSYDWRWIFYINLPIGVLAFALSYAVLRDPPYLAEQKAALARQPLRFDGIGLGLLLIVMACWEVMLSKGQQWDWLGDPFWRIQTLLVVFLVALAGFLVRELTTPSPVVELRVLRERNLAASCLIIFAAFGILYAATTQLPALLQTLFGYDAYLSGLVMSPAGFFSIAMMVVVGTALGRGVDARWLIGTGLLILSAGSYWMSVMTLDLSPFQVIWPRVVMIVGLSFIFAPLNVAAYLYTPPRLRAAAVGIFALLRNEGGSFGTSVAQTIQERREQLHALRLGEHLDATNAGVAAFLEQARAVVAEHTADPVQAQAAAYALLDGLRQRAQAAAYALLDDLRQKQAASLAFFDVFWVASVAALLLVGAVFLMKRSVAEQGAHLAAE